MMKEYSCSLFTQTEPSKRQKAILDTGNRLINESGLNKKCETLSKWMVHYLAEKTYAAENATTEQDRKVAQSICHEIVCKLKGKSLNQSWDISPILQVAKTLKEIQTINKK